MTELKQVNLYADFIDASASLSVSNNDTAQLDVHLNFILIVNTPKTIFSNHS